MKDAPSNQAPAGGAAGEPTMDAFEAAMVDAGYRKPERNRRGDGYLWEGEARAWLGFQLGAASASPAGGATAAAEATAGQDVLQDAYAALAHLLIYQSSSDKPTIHEYGMARRAKDALAKVLNTAPAAPAPSGGEKPVATITLRPAGEGQASASWRMRKEGYQLPFGEHDLFTRPLTAEALEAALLKAMEFAATHTWDASVSKSAKAREIAAGLLGGEVK